MQVDINVSSKDAVQDVNTGKGQEAGNKGRIRGDRGQGDQEAQWDTRGIGGARMLHKFMGVCYSSHDESRDETRCQPRPKPGKTKNDEGFA